MTVRIGDIYKHKIEECSIAASIFLRIIISVPIIMIIAGIRKMFLSTENGKSQPL